MGMAKSLCVAAAASLLALSAAFVPGDEDQTAPAIATPTPAAVEDCPAGEDCSIDGRYSGTYSGTCNSNNVCEVDEYYCGLVHSGNACSISGTYFGTCADTGGCAVNESHCDWLGPGRACSFQDGMYFGTCNSNNVCAVD